MCDGYTGVLDSDSGTSNGEAEKLSIPKEPLKRAAAGIKPGP